jgi:hypothetical protein
MDGMLAGWNAGFFLFCPKVNGLKFKSSSIFAG